MTPATPGQAAHQAETVAIAFHQAYEELAPQYGYRTREASAKPWDEVPANNAALMVATAARLLETGMISVAAQEPHAAAELAALADTWQAKYREYADASMENAAEPDYARAQRAIGVAYKKCAEQLRTAVSAPAPPAGPAPEMAAAALRQAASADEKERAK